MVLSNLCKTFNSCLSFFKRNKCLLSYVFFLCDPLPESYMKCKVKCPLFKERPKARKVNWNFLWQLGIGIGLGLMEDGLKFSLRIRTIFFYYSTHIFSVLVIIISICLTSIEDKMRPLHNNWNRVGWFCTAHGKAKVFPLGLVSCRSKQREAITHCLPAYAPLFAFHTLYWTEYKKIQKKIQKKGTI